MLTCDTCCAERPRVAVDKLEDEHPGEKVKEPVLTEPVMVQLPKFPLKFPVVLSKVPVPPLNGPPTTVQVEPTQLSVPPWRKGKDCAAARPAIPSTKTATAQAHRMLKKNLG